MQFYQIHFTVFVFISPILAMKGYDFDFWSNLVETPRAVPILPNGHPIKQLGPDEFSFCMYVFLRGSDTSGVMTLLSFASLESRNNDEVFLKLNYGTNYTHFVINTAEPPIQYVPPIMQWVHICCTWNRTNGQAILYIDGEFISQPRGLKGRKIGGNGFLVLGQDQDEYDGSYDWREGLVGKLTQFNLWNRVITPAEVNKVRLCELLGDAVNWETVSWAGFYNLRMEPSDAPCGDHICSLESCPAHHSVSSPLDVTSSKRFKKITMPLVKTIDYKPLAIINGDYIKNVKNVNKLTICAWFYSNFKTLDAPIIQNFKPAIFHGHLKDSNESVSSFGAETDIHGNLRIYIHAKVTYQWVVTKFKLKAEGWQHMCVSWWSKMGRGQLFVDGEFIKGNGAFAAGVEFPTMTFRLTQIQYDAAEDSKRLNGVAWKVVNFNVWSKRLKKKEVAAIYCNLSYVGDLISWKSDQINVLKLM